MVFGIYGTSKPFVERSRKEIEGEGGGVPSLGEGPKGEFARDGDTVGSERDPFSGTSIISLTVKMPGCIYNEPYSILFQLACAGHDVV